MNIKYINIYNNLVNLTRNKVLYKNLKKQDIFSDRLIFLLLHFAYFKDESNKAILQEVYDYIFRQLELSIREIGYGDQSINKKMKIYINSFYSMLDKIHNWDSSSDELKKSILLSFLDEGIYYDDLIKYFNNYIRDLSNNPLNFYIKGVLKA